MLICMLPGSGVAGSPNFVLLQGISVVQTQIIFNFFSRQSLQFVAVGVRQVLVAHGVSTSFDYAQVRLC